MPSIDPLAPGDYAAFLAQTPDAQVVDVRTEEEFVQLGHLPEARLIPLHTLPQRLDELNPEAPTVLVCQHGVRSMDASWFLASRGFARVLNFSGGMAAWPGDVVYGTAADLAAGSN